MPEITVTATRYERELDLTSKSVSVITRDQIEARNARNVQELLEEVPGVSLSRAGGLGGQIVMRGFNSNDFRTVLFIDGDRFRGRSTLEYNLLDPNQIERIEIIRGPASSLYGPDALAGLINVITRRAKGDPSGPFRLVPRLRALDYNSVNQLRGTRAEVEGLGHGVDSLVGLSWRQADDYQSPLGKIPNSAFDVFQTDLRLGYTPVVGHRVEIIAKFAEVESGRAGGIFGAPGAPLLRLREDPLRERFAKLSYAGRLQALELDRLEASIYGRQLFSHLASDDARQPNRLIQGSAFNEGPLVLGGKLFGVRPWGRNLLSVGADFFYENRPGATSASRTTTFNPNGSIKSISESPLKQEVPDATQTDIGVFVQNDWDPSPSWTISAGGRVDYIHTKSKISPVPDPKLTEIYERNRENTEVPLTGSLGVIYRPWQVLHFVTNVGKGFRAPAITESFGAALAAKGFFLPNPDLKSEEGVTYEVGARIRLSRLHANLTAFHSDYSNLIVRRPVTFKGLPSFQRQNVGAARVRGLEVDATWSFAANWEAFMNAAYLLGTDTTTDKPLPYIPPFNGLLGGRYTLADNGMFVEGVSKWSLRKDRVDDSQERETAGFVVFNVYAGIDLWKLSSKLPELRLRIGLENLLNQAYRQPATVEDVRFPPSNTNPLVEPGRAVSIALTSRF